jgi:hypothetical protein
LLAAITRTLAFCRRVPPRRWNSRSCRNRQLDLPGFGLVGAGERPALVAEQLRFQQLFGQRRAVDRDERAALARRGLVNEPRHDFLARARFSLQENRRVGWRHAQRPRDHPLPGGRSADHPPVGRHRLALVGDRSDTRVDPLGPAARGRPIPFRRRQLLVRDGHRHVVGDVLRRRHIIRPIGVRLFGQKTEAHHLVARDAPNIQNGSVSVGEHGVDDVRWRAAREATAGPPQIAHDRERLVILDRASEGASRIPGRPCLERHVAAAILKDQLERVMRQRVCDDLRHAGKHAANVQHFRDRAEQGR